MDIAVRSLIELFPEKIGKYDVSLKYSGMFSKYNGNVRMKGSDIAFSLSSEWRDVDVEIQIGMMQHLLLKLFKSKNRTHNLDLYHSFLKRVHIAVPKTKDDPLLSQRFSLVNERFFGGTIEKPNLSWCHSINKLGSYEYGGDEIQISLLLKEHIHLLDYVMYHEMLHKYHKFRTNGGRSHYHTKEFRLDERSYPNSGLLEKELEELVTGARRRRRSLFRKL